MFRSYNTNSSRFGLEASSDQSELRSFMAVAAQDLILPLARGKNRQLRELLTTHRDLGATTLLWSLRAGTVQIRQYKYDSILNLEAYVH